MSRVIFKMTFKHPNFKNTVSNNVGHVEYIATRPGTDKTVTEADLKKELEKGIEDLTSSDETYVKYINERPNSHGLFGQDGIENPKDVQEELSQVNSFVWRGIVSLKEDDAKNLGYLNKEQWQNMLRKKIPDIANEMGISITNLRWVAAVHMEKGHPHSHVMLWEKEPKRTTGIVNTKTLDNIRKLLTDEIFEEERFQLMNEKNIMRDLIRDLAKDDVSKATRLLKDVRAAGLELKTFIEGFEKVGVSPKLYSYEEEKIANMIKDLSVKLPGKGRVALKFMPDDIKNEVRSIADYLLTQPEFTASLVKNLKAVEELTRMYTGKDEAIQKARDNAYKDIRDRISQIILKGAVESQKDNIFYVDYKLSQNAVNFIKNISNQINLIPEQTKVLNEIAVGLYKIGYSDEDSFKIINDFMQKEDILYSKEYIKEIIKNVYENNSQIQDIDSLATSKKIDYYLSLLKLSGATEHDAFSHIKATIKKESQELERQLKLLRKDGILKKIGEYYKLTNKGIVEFLKVKELDRAEKEIFKMLESDGEEVKIISFTELLDNKSIFQNLYNKEPEEFKLSKFDAKVRDEFGEDNKITLNELERRIYEKYTDSELNTNTDKAEQEFDILKKRIERLALNGHVVFDKATEAYSFTEESKRYFEYDNEKGIYVLSKQAIDKFNIPEVMEFTRYDANITLSYIDKTDNGILTTSKLKEMLYQEITNKTAHKYYDKFIELINTDKLEKTKNYISIDKEGNLRSTEEGKWLSINLNKLNKYFREANGSLTDEKLKKLCITEQEYIDISNKLMQQVVKGHIEKDQTTGIYKINTIVEDINNLLYQIHKEGGTINKENLKVVLEKNVPNYEAEKQFMYLSWRLNNLKTQGYLKGEDNEYQLSVNGIEKRADILAPERNTLRRTLSYLERLGLIAQTDEGYQVTKNYYKYMKDIAVSKEEKLNRTSNYITKDIYELIDRTQDKISIGKIERTNERIATGKYINGVYEKIKTGYEDIRGICGITNIIEKTLNNLSTTLLVSGVDLEGTKEILNKWNIKSNSNIDPEKLNNIIDKAFKTVSDNSLWGKTTIISSNEWKEMFEILGVHEKYVPQWIYKGENWKSFNHNMGLSVINDVWKNIWSELEKQRMKSEAQSDYMKKQLNKQQAANQSKEAIKEQIRKNKDRSSLYMDEELEM